MSLFFVHFLLYFTISSPSSNTFVHIIYKRIRFHIEIKITKNLRSQYILPLFQITFCVGEFSILVKNPCRGNPIQKVCLKGVYTGSLYIDSKWNKMANIIIFKLLKPIPFVLYPAHAYMICCIAYVFGAW